ncbi:hypothetical protein LCGC14_1916260 [marine sediment metagenome]|uniref:Uncharacterized protein n=1 Tax=marine sediment metagenome TaxID=412755 RepID=A0A0F9FRZ9_9ZZZZ
MLSIRQTMGDGISKLTSGTEVTRPALAKKYTTRLFQLSQRIYEGPLFGYDFMSQLPTGTCNRVTTNHGAFEKLYPLALRRLLKIQKGDRK